MCHCTILGVGLLWVVAVGCCCGFLCFVCCFGVLLFFFPLAIKKKNKSSNNYHTCITALKKHVFPKLLSPFTVTSKLALEREFSSLSKTSFSCSFLLSFSTFLFSNSLFSCCLSTERVKNHTTY